MTTYQQLYHIYTDINDTQRQSDIVTEYSKYAHIKQLTAYKQLDCAFVSDLLRLKQTDRALVYIESKGPTGKSTEMCILQAYHRVLMTKQWFQEALTTSYYMIEATTNDPKLGGINIGHKLQSETFFALNQTEQAVNVLILAHAINETDTDVILTLAETYHNTLRNYNKSEEYYSKAVEILQTDTPLPILLLLGKLQMASNRPRRAARTLSLYISACNAEYQNSTVAVPLQCSEGHMVLGTCFEMS